MDKKEITENKENVVIDDFDFSMIADFFNRVDRQGPGGDAGQSCCLSNIKITLK